MQTGSEIDSGLYSLAAILRVLGQAVDLGQLQHRFGRQGQRLSPAELVRCGRQLELKIRLIKSAWDRLAGTQLPAIAELNDGRFVVLAACRTEAGRQAVLLLDQATGRPISMNQAEFQALWSG